MARPFLIVLLLLVPVLASAQTFRFGLRRDLPTGVDPAGVAVADFDRDGNLDVAVTERGVDSMSVRLGDGTGRFGARVLYATGDYPTAIAAGDLNGDGDIDLAIANGASNTVTLYLGAAQGGFRGRLDFAAGLTPSAVTIGDASGDGRPDVVVANAGSSSVTILLGLGSGAGLSGSSLPVATGSGPRAVLVADIDRDAVNDLVTANGAADSISVRKGLPAGGFGPRTDIATQDQPAALALGDLDADGWSDLAFVMAGSLTVGICMNNSGTFALPNILGVENNPDAVAIADFDGDALPDLVVGYLSSATLSFMQGNGNGTFGPKQNVPAGGSGVLSIVVADMDGDGRRDVVFPALNPPAASVLFNNGRGPFGPRVDYAAGTTPQGLVVADLNGDTRPDIAVANFGSANISRFMNQGNGAFGGHVDIPAPTRPLDLSAADLDGDLDLDLVLSTYAGTTMDSTRVSVYLNPGGGAFAAHTDYDAGTYNSRVGVVIGDLTHDGKLDILAGHRNSTIGQILTGNGLGAFALGPELSVYNGPTSFDLADLDANGSLDVLAGGTTGGNGILSVFVADGAGGFAPRVDYPVIDWPAGIAHGDFDENGKLDVAVMNKGNGSVSVLFGNGLGALIDGPVLLSLGSQSTSLAVGDVNQDGDLDIIGGRSDARDAVFYGGGDGTFSLACLVPGGSLIAAVALGQLDGNGTLDLVSSNNGGNVSVHPGLAKTRTTLAVNPNPSALGQSLTYQATVTKALPDSSSPSGSVRFFDGVRLLGSAPLVGAVATLVQSGNLPWERELSAAYVGDGRFHGSISASLGHLTYLPAVGVPPTGPAMLALAPLGNPARGGNAVRVRIVLAGAQAARLSLHDVRGRVLAVRVVTEDGVAEIAPAARLAPGVYLVKLEQGGQSATARAVVL
jgi:hypothetical protein